MVTLHCFTMFLSILNVITFSMCAELTSCLAAPLPLRTLHPYFHHTAHFTIAFVLNIADSEIVYEFSHSILAFLSRILSLI